MNLSTTSHLERSAGGQAGEAQSKDPVEERAVSSEDLLHSRRSRGGSSIVSQICHGVLRLRYIHLATSAPLRMTRVVSGYLGGSEGRKEPATLALLQVSQIPLAVSITPPVF